MRYVPAIIFALWAAAAALGWRDDGVAIVLLILIIAIVVGQIADSVRNLGAGR
jgi:hypothetical protein